MPPARLGDYLRDFDALMAGTASPGCPTAISATAACTSGSTSRSAARRRRRRCSASSWSTPRTWSPVTAARCPASTATAGPAANCCRGCTRPTQSTLFGAVKSVFDPREPAQPGRDRRPAAAGRGHPRGRRAGRRQGWRWPTTPTAATSPQAVHRCTGVGKCRADNAATGGVMCPSYLATREEKDSTRGRARVLQEMVDGAAVTGWLAIPGGARGARPVPVVQGLLVGLPDRYRHGVLQGRGAPSELPGPAASRVALHAGPAAALGGTGGPDAARGELRCWPPRHRRRLAMSVGRGGPAPRSIPPFARKTFRSLVHGRTPGGAAGDPVLLFVDSFTNYFTPEVGIADRAGAARPPATRRG